ncbi:hypothetical protein C2G38_2044803 [Gigaspora rosea]|uniref:Uncharacterized protein n=1 Tax=Gigaspora rosea TaxID=44941 RepID=A0A397UJ98_9GLOM|nr:hypothetical protein C2G38_2044803 [Gigaspora rosea]
MGFLFDFEGFLSLGVVHILLCRVLGLELDTSSDLRQYSCVGPCTSGSFGLVLINFVGRGLGTFRKGLVLWSISSWLSNSVVLELEANRLILYLIGQIKFGELVGSRDL